MCVTRMLSIVFCTYPDLANLCGKHISHKTGQSATIKNDTDKMRMTSINTIEDFLALDAARRNGYEIARPFFQQRSMRRVDFSALDRTVLSGMLNENDEALDALGLSDDALNSFPEADLIISIADRRDSTQCFYIAVEASFTGHDDDVRRATDRARILRCATGRDAYAVVAAVRLDQYTDRARIHENAATYLAELSENDALWYPLVERDLEPPDPL